MILNKNAINFRNTTEEQFFIANISSGNSVDASWELQHTKDNIILSETCDFKTEKINLWGWKHVISPELFIKINLKPGENMQWNRTYHVREQENI